MKLFPKCKTGGVVSDTVMGVGGLIIGVVIILVIVSTLLGSNLFTSDDVSSSGVNETGWINGTTYTLNGSNYLDAHSFSISRVYNGTDVIASGNYTVSSIGVVSNLTSSTYAKVNFTYTYLKAGVRESTTTDLTYNFTDGIDNISEKIPTILLIVAVVFLFGVLVLLVNRSKQMGIGNSGSL